MAQKLTFIINPVAGPGNNLEFWNKLARQLKKNKIRFRAKFTKRQNHAAKLALKRLKKESDASIVSVGGDGTFNEVASALVGSQTTLAHVPRGSGNGLARMLKIPGKGNRLISYLKSGRTELIDMGKANEKSFFCTAGFGLDALIAQRFTHSQTRGFKSYIFYVLKSFLRYDGVIANFTLDDEPFEGRFFTVTFANANQFGNNAFIAPRAQLNDGLLNVTIIKPFARILTPFVALALFGKFIHRLPFVETRKVKSARILSLSEECFHRDGDSDKVALPINIQVIPKALRIRTP